MAKEDSPTGNQDETVLLQLSATTALGSQAIGTVGKAAFAIRQLEMMVPEPQRGQIKTLREELARQLFAIIRSTPGMEKRI